MYFYSMHRESRLHEPKENKYISYDKTCVFVCRTYEGKIPELHVNRIPELI